MKHFLSGVLVITASAIFAQATSDAEVIIRKNALAFSQNYVNGNYEALVDAYTDDAKIFPEGQDILSGREAIRKYWTPSPDRKSKAVYHKLIPEEIRINGTVAYDWGRYEGRTQNADGTETSWSGKYVVVWHEVSPGVWKMYLDIWNH